LSLAVRDDELRESARRPSLSDQKILQNIISFCRGERLLADPAMDQVLRESRLRMDANELVARRASGTHEVRSLGHEKYLR
jgi:hypothetical protein